MINRAKQKNIVFRDFLICAIVILPLYNASNIILRCIGTTYIGCLILLSCFTFLKNRVELYSSLSHKSIGYECLLLVIMLILAIRSFSLNGWKTYIQFLCILLLFHTFMTIDYKRIHYKRVSLLIASNLLINYLPMFFNKGYSAIDYGYKSIYSTTTFMGIFSCLMIQICILVSIEKQKKCKIYILFYLYLVLKSKVRTAQIVVLLFLFVYAVFYILKFYKKKKGFYRLLKIFVVCIILFFTLIYPQISNFEWFPFLAQLVYRYTGKMLLTGREIIWSEAFSLIEQRPLFGYGLYYGHVFNLPPHNSYLSILLQGGIILLLIFSLFLNSLLNDLFKNKNNKYTFLVIMCWVIDLILCVNEVMLIHGQYGLSIILWLILAIGFSASKNNIICNK